jgi:RNA polymerase sigma factor (sigma-70 family)
MGEAGKPRGEPSLERETYPLLTDLYDRHYRSLFRLAALLTGDAATAEAVVRDSFVALRRLKKRMRTSDEALAYLRRILVSRSRVAAHRRRAAASEPVPAMAALPDRADAPDDMPPFDSSAINQALRALPTGQREAVVLTLYLDLTNEQTAEAMRVSQATVRRWRAGATAALRATLPASP